MIKVVQGNDFLLHITLTEESIDIGSADGVKLRLVGFSNSVEIPCEVLSAHEISSRVEGDLPCGTYGVEITGRLVGNDFRSFEVGQIGIVYTNAEADHAPTDVLSIETAEIGMGVGMAIMQIREQSDWAETDTESRSYIKNKPDLSKKADKDYVDGRVEDVEAFAQELYETKAEKRAVAKLDHALKEPQVVGNVLRFVDATHSGYIDVTLPTTPAQVQSDWEEDDNTKKSYILNKPDVYTKSQVDTKLATKASVSNVYTKTQTDNKLKEKADASDVEALETAMAGKADKAGVMSFPALSTLADGRQEFLANVNSPDSPFRMVIPAPADVNKAYVDEQLAGKASVSEVEALDAGKVDKESGKGLSEENYSSTEKAKLGALPTKSELDAELESKVDSTTLDDALTDYVYGNGFQVFQQPISYDSTTGSANLDAAFKKQLKKELMKVGFAEVVSDIAFLYEDDTRTNLIAQIPLIAYALKSQTYTKAQVDDIVAAVKQFEYEVVAELPTASAATKGKIYLVPSSNPKTQNVKDEFITTEDNGVFAWEQIGTTTIDLSDYYNKHEADNLLDAKVNKVAGKQLTTEDYTTADKNKLAALPTSVQLAQALNAKAAAATTYSKTEVDSLVAKSKPMVVNAIPDEETETGELKADKPFAEVLAWAKAGGTVVLRESPDEDLATEYPLIYHDASMLQFRVAPESTCVFGFDLYEDETLEYIEDYSAQENIDNIGERVDALDNKIFQSETTYSLPMEGEERMNPPYTPFGGGPLTKWATLPAGITQREDISEFSLDDGATWYSQNTSTRAVAVVDGKVYWSVNGSAPTPPPEPSDTLQIKVVGVVEKLQNQLDSLDARVEEVVKTYDVRMLEDGTITSQDADLDSAEIITRIEDKKGEDWLHVTITDTPSVDKFLVPRVNYHDTQVFFSGVVLINGVQKIYTFSLDSNNVLTCVGQIPVPADIAQVSQTIRKSNTLYTYDGGTKYAGQSGNLLTAPTWLTALDGMDLSVYKRLRFFLTPSTHSVGLSTNNVTAMIEVEVMLDAASITANMPYYSGGNVTICANNDNRLFSVGILVQDRSADGVSHWDFAVKTVSLYGTSSTDITDSYVYKIEGCYE